MPKFLRSIRIRIRYLQEMGISFFLSRPCPKFTPIFDVYGEIWA